MGSNLGRFLSNLGQNLVKIANVEVMIFEDMCLSESVSAKHWAQQNYFTITGVNLDGSLSSKITVLYNCMWCSDKISRLVISKSGCLAWR